MSRCRACLIPPLPCAITLQLQQLHAALELLLKAWQQGGRRRLWNPPTDALLRNTLASLKSHLAASEGPCSVHKAAHAVAGAGSGSGHIQAPQPLHHVPCNGRQLSPHGAQEGNPTECAAAQQRGFGAMPDNADTQTGHSRGLSLRCEVAQVADGHNGGSRSCRGVGGHKPQCAGGGEVGVGGLGCNALAEGEAGACEEDAGDEAKTCKVDGCALEVKGVQRVAGACVKALKELLMSESKMD